MIRRRLDISATLEVLSPLHVGDGRGFSFKSESDPAPSEVSTVHRDAEGNPWIPGSSLKGLLRRLAPPDPALARLFGDITGEEPLAARLRVFGATWLGVDPARTEGLPYAADWKRPGAYLQAQTALDGGSGVAKDHALRRTEVVAPGAQFEVRFSIIWPQAAEAEDQNDLRLLETCVGRMMVEGGVQLGAGDADGLGYVRLDPTSVTVSTLWIKPGKGLEEAEEPYRFEPRPAPRSARRRLRIRLAPFPFSPFAHLDSSYGGPGDGSGPQLRAQGSDGRSKPLTAGASISGALRARALWLHRLAALRSAADCDEAVIEELFGKTGRRAKLRIAEIQVANGAAPQTLTSVKINRFSGAPIDGGLFAIEAFRDVCIEASIWVDSLSEPAEALLGGLVADLGENGLTLGYGASRGFGWFTAEMAEFES